MKKAIFFDVANTLLHKPSLFSNIHDVLRDHGIEMDTGRLQDRHKILSECTKFPDKTHRKFYDKFNSELLRALGILPTRSLLDGIFERCSYLPWRAFDDTAVLSEIRLPVGIISNWDSTLSEKLKTLLPYEFKWIIGSKVEGKRKPDPGFFRKIVAYTGYSPSDIIIVGDSVKLDIEPANKIGMQAILIDRTGFYESGNVPRITSLTEILDYL